MKHFSGLVVAGLAGLLSLWVSSWLSFGDSSVLALVLGLGLSGLLRGQTHLAKGLGVASKIGLQVSIVLLGFRLSFSDIQDLGLWSFRLSLPLLVLAFTIAVMLGQKLGLGRHLSLLIGFGTAICGGSAIASAAPILESEEEEVGLALGTIFFFNLLGLVLFPAVGQWLNLSQQTFGIWAGTAINDTSSVVAAGYAYGDVAGDVATIVKLARTLLILPTCLVLSMRRFGKEQSGHLTRLRAILPSFILLFLLASILTSLGLVPEQVRLFSQPIAKWLMATALFAVGSKLSLEQIKRAGLRPILLGAAVWGSVSLASLFLQQLLSP